MQITYKLYNQPTILSSDIIMMRIMGRQIHCPKNAKNLDLVFLHNIQNETKFNHKVYPFLKGLYFCLDHWIKNNLQKKHG